MDRVAERQMRPPLESVPNILAGEPRIDLLVSRYERMIGLARYTLSLQKSLTQAGLSYRTVEPEFPLPVRLSHTFLRPFGFGVRDFFNIYPLFAKPRPDAIVHFTHQMMGILLPFHKNLGKVVITVHDIVPYMMRDDPEQNVYRRFYDRFTDNLAMQKLRQADRLIAISGYTKKKLVELLDCSPEKVDVVLYGLDHEIFRPVPATEAFFTRYNLDQGDRFLLYVGSENPRKNLPTLVQALAQVKRSVPKFKLIKVGTPIYLKHHRMLHQQIRELNLENEVIFIDHPSQEDLAVFYSMADAFVFPSLFEGFGLPVLEAMACGTPVITSNTSSLPEVAGDAAILVDPYNVDEIAAAMRQVLEDPGLAADLCRRGLARAAQFTWERTARETIAVYEKVLNQGKS